MANYVEPSNEPNKIEADLREMLAATVGRWTGCDWITSYGPKKLNLQGLQSRQAYRISDYTSAEESVCWAEAAGYLEQIEQDAAKAEMLAKRAVRLLFDGRDAEALEAIDLAVAIEAKYREPVVWRQLQNAVRAQGLRGAKSF